MTATHPQRLRNPIQRHHAIRPLPRRQLHLDGIGFHWTVRTVRRPTWGMNQSTPFAVHDTRTARMAARSSEPVAAAAWGAGRLFLVSRFHLPDSTPFFIATPYHVRGRAVPSTNRVSSGSRIWSLHGKVSLVTSAATGGCDGLREFARLASRRHSPPQGEL